MINPTNPPTDQQIYCFKPTINQSQPTDPTMTQTPDPTHFSHNTGPKHRTQPTSATTQPRPKHRTQPWTKHRTQPRPTTPLGTGHSKKKKKNHNHHSDPRRQPRQKKKKQPQNHQIATHQKNWATVMCDVCWEENGVWVWREERTDGEREKEEREDNWIMR